MRRDSSLPNIYIRLNHRGIEVNIPRLDSFKINPLPLRILLMICLPVVCVDPRVTYPAELSYAKKYLRRYIHNKDTHDIHVRETSDFLGNYYILSIRPKDEILHEIVEQLKRQRCMGA